MAIDIGGSSRKKTAPARQADNPELRYSRSYKPPTSTTPQQSAPTQKLKRKGKDDEPTWWERVKRNLSGGNPNAAEALERGATLPGYAMPAEYLVSNNPAIGVNGGVGGAVGSGAIPPAWWSQMAQGYANQASAYQASGGGQPPEGNLSDFYFRHPDKPTAPATTATTSGGYGGYGGYWRRGGGGGGRGGGYSYAPKQSYTPYEKSGPAWARGLANWSIG